MSEKKKEDELLSHNYDGIEEYDNDLPLWWRQLFWITFIFGIVYVIYYHMGPGLSQEETLAIELEEASKKAAWEEEKRAAAAPVDQNARLLALVDDQELLSLGKTSYAAKCAACHGPDGGGVIGPNLTDEFWIHGGTLAEIRHTIENGVLEKGMLAWKSAMPPAEIDAVTLYTWSIYGTMPANPKASEGVKVGR